MDPKKPTDGFMASQGELQHQGGQADRAASVAVAEKHAELAKYNWMGPSLRRMYDDVLNEPIPDSFVDLLKQLHDQQKRRQS